MSKQTDKTTIVFLDTIGRTIIGKKASENEETVSVENPAVVHVQPNPQTNQLQLQILPLFFREFQADRNEPTVWNYLKRNITTCNDLAFAMQFVNQYEQMFRPVENAPAPTAPEEPSVIKLFDEEDSQEEAK
jgi:hypothetical protein